MVHDKTLILYYPWDYENERYHAVDTKGNALLKHIIGDTLADIMTRHNDMTEGIQLLRLRLGSSTIVAQKRLNDIKVTITTTYYF